MTKEHAPEEILENGLKLGGWRVDDRLAITLNGFVVSYVTGTNTPDFLKSCVDSIRQNYGGPEGVNRLRDEVVVILVGLQETLETTKRNISTTEAVLASLPPRIAGPVEVIVKDGEVSVEVAAALANRVPNKPVENIVFLREVVIQPGDRALIETWPLTFSRFAARGLVIPSSIGKHFLIHDLKVDGKSQFHEKTDGIPAERFSEKTISPSTFEDPYIVSFDECSVGKSLGVEVQNMSSETQKFCGCYIGRFLK